MFVNPCNFLSKLIFCSTGKSVCFIASFKVEGMLQLHTPTQNHTMIEIIIRTMVCLQMAMIHITELICPTKKNYHKTKAIG